MENPPLRIALLGLGRAGHFHLQSLRLLDDARLTWVFDTDKARCREVAQRHNCAGAASATEAIESEDVDAVIVATPTDAHFDLVQQALDAHKAVLAEKPLGRALSQIDDCFEKAKRNSLPLLVAFQRRFDPTFGALVRQVHDGAIGHLQFVRSVSRDNPVPAPEYIRTSGGIFHDCMVHDLDMVVHIVGQPPTHLSAFGSSFLPEIGQFGDLDNVAAAMSFSNGVVATVDINRKSVYGYDQRIEAFGDAGMLQADNRHATSVVHATEPGFMRPPIDFSFPTRYREAYLQELACFVRCVRGQEAVPISHADVRINYLLATGLELAAREKRVVPFDEIEK